MLTHDAVAASARATSARLGVDPAADRWLACLPLAHVGGLSVVTRALVTGTPLVVHDGFDASAVQAAADPGSPASVAAGGPATLVSLVPTALRRHRPRGVPAGGAGRVGHARAPAGQRRHHLRHDRDRQRRRLRRHARSTGSRCGSSTARSSCGARCCCGPTATAPTRRTAPAGSAPATPAPGTPRPGGCGCSAGSATWSSPAARTCGRWPSSGCWPATRPWPRWRWWAGPTRSGASGWWPWSCPPPGADPPTLAALRDAVKAELPAYAAPRELVLVESLPRTALGKVARARAPCGRRRQLATAGGRAVAGG